MQHRRCATTIGMFASSLALACGGAGQQATETDAATTDATTATTATTGAETDTETGDGTETDTGEVDDSKAQVVHSFGEYHLEPMQERQPCIQWTLNNDEPIYVNTVTLANDGAYHHSNWFMIPEDVFPGEDGFYKCSERGFTELVAAVEGGVLFAQSTQSRYEQQELPEGVVIKIPPRHKIVAGGHLLNLSSAAIDTELRMTLDIIHPRDVEVVTAPFRMTYLDLDILASSESWFSGDCEFAEEYADAAGKPLDLKLYWALPHYHYLGNYFALEILGGPRDGEKIFELSGFNGEGNGGAYDPPVDLTGATGLRFTCGYDNWTNFDVGWGVGDQEMCVMLGLADSAVMMYLLVDNGQGDFIDLEDGIRKYEGYCRPLVVAKNKAQSMPTQAEIDGPLYVPPTDPGSDGLPPVDPCVDADPMAPPHEPVTLASIRDTVLLPSCSYSACHGGAAAVHGLDFQAADLHAELMNHTLAADAGMPLIDPGLPENSWLYRLVSECAPQDQKGVAAIHMPLNAPVLLEDRMVAKIRAWIEAGALDN